ncbi:MAG: GntR family transcriptional regulator [Clostridiales bacterium]|nr:GntR family transcriptional regulator [Clostridiales bacterium]
MAWQFRNDIPIYTQLIAQIQQQIVSGALLPGERLPSVRDLAAEAGVNPNTMQRAMMEMEREELVHSQRTAGRFVTEDAQRIRQLRESMARQRVKEFLEGMYLLGFQTEEIVAFVQKEGENHEHSGV